MDRVRAISGLAIVAGTAGGLALAGLVGGVVGFVLAAAMTAGASRYGNALILRWLQARPLGASLREDRVRSQVGELAIRAGVDAPALWIRDGDQVNAFALTLGPGPVVCITRGLLNEPSMALVRALLALQLARIGSGAARTSSAGALVGGVLSWLSSLGTGSRADLDPNPFAIPTAPLLAPVSAAVCRLSVADDAERLAHQSAISWLGRKGRLQRALERAELLAHVHPLGIPAAIGVTGVVPPHAAAPPFSLARMYPAMPAVAERLAWATTPPDPSVRERPSPVPNAA